MNTQFSASTLPPVTHNSIPVITTELLAQLYAADVKHIQNNYLRNTDRFTAGKHYFKLEGAELSAFKKQLKQLTILKMVSQNARHIILWTERGAARHAKMLETDQAWEVFERLEDCYFNHRIDSCIEYDDGPDNSKEVIHALLHTPEHFISTLNGQLITSSLLVAEAFSKRHDNIIQKIESLDIPDNFASPNFSVHVQKIKAGAVTRDSKVYRMTKDGFMLLVMGFTGKRAMNIKIAYINAFNRMAAQLALQKTPLLDGQITPEQQEALKQLVLTRSKSVPPEHQPRAAITLWSALKSHFGRSYKEIDATQYTEALALVLRIPLVGDHPPADDRESPDNVMLLTDSTYRTQALEYIDDLLTRCNDYAEAKGIDVTQWNPANYELAASGLLADLLRHTRAELSFDSHMQPVIKVLPAGALYLSPTSDEAMRGLVARVVSTEMLMGMMNEGLARLDRERKAIK